MPGNPNLVIPLKNLNRSKGNDNNPNSSPNTKPSKTLEEIATSNKQNGMATFDFQDVIQILEETKVPQQKEDETIS